MNGIARTQEVSVLTLCVFNVSLGLSCVYLNHNRRKNDGVMVPVKKVTGDSCFGFDNGRNISLCR